MVEEEEAKPKEAKPKRDRVRSAAEQDAHSANRKYGESPSPRQKKMPNGRQMQQEQKDGESLSPRQKKMPNGRQIQQHIKTARVSRILFFLECTVLNGRVHAFSVYGGDVWKLSAVGPPELARCAT